MNPLNVVDPSKLVMVMGDGAAGAGVAAAAAAGAAGAASGGGDVFIEARAAFNSATCFSNSCIRWVMSGVAGAAASCAHAAVALPTSKHTPRRALETCEDRCIIPNRFLPAPSHTFVNQKCAVRVSEANSSDVRGRCLTHISHSGYRKMPSKNVYGGHKESLSIRYANALGISGF